MPDTFNRKARWWFVLGVMGGMLIALIVVSLIAWDARRDINEQVRDTRVAEVAACYASARGRPRLIVILRAIAASIQDDSVARATIRDFIAEYEQRTPLEVDCDELAINYRLDPAEFPPPTPRGEENTP